MQSLEQIRLLFEKLKGPEDGFTRKQVIESLDDNTAKVLYEMAKGWEQSVLTYAFKKFQLSPKLYSRLPEENTREIAAELKSELYVKTSGKSIKEFHWEDKDPSILFIAYAYMIKVGELDLTKQYGSKEKGYKQLAKKHGFMHPKMASQFKNRIIHYGSLANRKGIKKPFDVLHQLKPILSRETFEIAKGELFPSWPNFTI